jgi:ABC-type dipeptide/oligopeptide/nickel transport system permease component
MNTNLRAYLLGRIGLLIPVLLAVSLLTFGLSNLTPGDPARLTLQAQGHEPTEEAVRLLRQQLGLNEPIHLRYLNWMGRVLKGDLGHSFASDQPVLTELLRRFPATLRLTLTGLCLALLISVPVGLATAYYQHSFFDQITRLITVVGSAIPPFWLGMLLLLLFGVRLKWFPIAGSGDLSHLILPALTLALGLSATYVRLLRATVAEVLGQEFVRVLLAKGLGGRRILLKHALRTATPTFLTIVGLNLGHLLGGTVIVESVFSWPGLGQYAIEAVYSRDYPVLMGYVLLMTLIVVLTNMAVDIGCRLADPRVRLGGHSYGR